MKKPVYLNANDIDISVIPPEIYQKIKTDADERLYSALKICKEGTDEFYKFKHQNERQFINELLTEARPRMDLFDHNCNLILSADEYNRRKEDAERNGTRMNTESLTMNVRVRTADGSGKKEIPVDAGIYHHIQNMDDMGYVTAVCCSGMLADHPNERYVQNSETGLYVKGEPICWNKQGSVAYIGFYKQDDKFPELIGNTPEQIEDIRKVAEESGWIPEDSELFGRPAVVLRLPVTLDGTGSRELLAEGRRLVNLSHPNLFVTDFMKAIELRSKYMKAVYANHGGVVMYNDKMLKRRWSALSVGLGLAAYQRKEAARRNGETPVMTRIDSSGREQMQRLLERLGIRLDNHALDRHVPTMGGNYSNVWLQIKGDRAYCPPDGFDENAGHTYEYFDFNKKLVEALVSDIDIFEKNNKPYIGCSVLDKKMPPKEINSGAFSAYAMGHFKKEDLAWFYYNKEICSIGGRHKSEVKDGYGWTEQEGNEKYYYGESNGRYVLYKDNRAFQEQKGICYISQQDLQRYTDDLKNGTAKDIEEYGETWHSLMDKVSQVYPVSTTKVSDEIFQRLEGETLDKGIDKYVVEQHNRQAKVHGINKEDKITVVWVDRCMPYTMAQQVMANAGLVMPENKEDVKGLKNYDEYHLGDDMDISKMMPRSLYLLFKNGRFETFGQGSGLLHNLKMSNPNHQMLMLHEIHDAQRITDFNVYSASGDRLFYRCKIDGEQQPGKAVPSHLVVQTPQGLDIKEPYMAAVIKHCQNELEKRWRAIFQTLPEMKSDNTVAEEQNKGFKR